MPKKYPLVALVLVASLFATGHAWAEPAPQTKSTPKAESKPEAKEDARPPRRPPVRNNGAGTVNLKKIMEVLGLAQQIEMRRAHFQKQVEKVQEEKQVAFEQKRKQFGDKPTDEQRQELMKLAQESQETIKQVRTQAEKQLEELNQYAMNVLKVKASGPIQAVAEKHGLAVVLLEPNAVVVYRAADADITDEVLDEMQANSPNGLAVPRMPAQSKDKSEKPK